MRTRAFTLVEILIVIVVIGILSSLAFPAYQSIVENANARVCQTNLDAISTSLDIYAMENESMPGSLSQIPEKYLERAYARIMKRSDAWKIKLAYFITGLKEQGVAYASPITSFKDLAGGQTKLLNCPSHTCKYAAGSCYSYGINPAALNISSKDYLNLGSSTVVIADSNTATLVSEAYRHKKIGFLSTRKYANRSKKTSKEGSSVFRKFEDGEETEVLTRGKRKNNL